MIDLDAIRARDRDYDDVFEAQANMSKHIAHRLVAWPVADRRALLAYADELRSRLAEYEKLLAQAGEAFNEGSKCIDDLRSRLADIEAQNRVMWDVANDREARLAEAEGIIGMNRACLPECAAYWRRHKTVAETVSGEGER